MTLTHPLDTFESAKAELEKTKEGLRSRLQQIGSEKATLRAEEKRIHAALGRKPRTKAKEIALVPPRVG